jgi:release factor glutamine methyltransferase
MLPVLFRKVIHRTYKPLLEYYLSGEREYRYEDIRLKILPGVFHPGFFFSTKLLLEFLKPINFKSKTLLELGAGSGLISIASARKDAIVTATDISYTAIENIKLNRLSNNLNFTVIHSDLFENIPKQAFDFIIINPPYYKRNVVTESDYCWYAGEHLQYFQKLFSQIKSYINVWSRAYMILINDCDIEGILSLAKKSKVNMEVVSTKNNLLEISFIYQLT